MARLLNGPLQTRQGQRRCVPRDLLQNPRRDMLRGLGLERISLRHKRRDCLSRSAGLLQRVKAVVMPGEKSFHLRLWGMGHLTGLGGIVKIGDQRLRTVGQAAAVLVDIRVKPVAPFGLQTVSLCQN